MGKENKSSGATGAAAGTDAASGATGATAGTDAASGATGSAGTDAASGGASASTGGANVGKAAAKVRMVKARTLTFCTLDGKDYPPNVLATASEEAIAAAEKAGTVDTSAPAVRAVTPAANDGK